MQVEFDHGLRATDRLDLALHLGVDRFLGGDIRCEFHDLDDFATSAEDRIIGGFQPDFLASLGDALELRRLVLATAKLLPERAILRTIALCRGHEHTVMAARYLIGGVTDRFQEVRIRRDDRAVGREVNNRLRAIKGRQNRVSIASKQISEHGPPPSDRLSDPACKRANRAGA